LHRRLAAAGSRAQFLAGMPPVLYWIGVLVSIGGMAGIAVLAVRAIMLDEWKAAAVVACFFALFAWQIGGFILRNRPGVYRPDAVPQHVLPRPRP